MILFFNLLCPVGKTGQIRSAQIEEEREIAGTTSLPESSLENEDYYIDDNLYPY